MIKEILNQISNSRKSSFVRLTCVFAWFTSLVLSIAGLFIDTDQFSRFFISQFGFFMGANSLLLILVFVLPREKLFISYILHICFVVIAFLILADLDEDYAEFYLPFTALELFFGAALLPAYPKPILYSSIVYWLTMTLIRYLVLPEVAHLNYAWVTANVLMFVSIGFALIFYGLFTNLSETVKAKRRQIQELNEIATLLNITMNESQFGLTGYAENGQLKFQRGANIERLREPKDVDSYDCRSLSNFQKFIAQCHDFDSKKLFEQFHEIEVGRNRYLLRAYNLHEVTLISHMDVTEMREIEEKLRKNQKLSLIGEITSGVAHNYNNALAIALSNLEAIPQSENQELWEHHIKPSIDAIEQSTEVSRKLLALAGRQNLNFGVFDAVESINQMREFLVSALGSEAQLRIRTGAPLYINTDKSEFESMILNLVINARNAIGRRDGLVEISTYSTPESAIISVKDNGSGIDDDIVDKIFDPFFSTNSEHSSTGLGLSIVKGFVEQSSGKVEFETDPKGTLFSLQFPLDFSTHENVSSDKEALKEPAKKIDQETRKYVLIVDDNVHVAKGFARLLDKLGFKASFETSPSKALEIISKRKDVKTFLLDLSMPEMDGIELGQEILKIRPDASIYIVTGDMSSERLKELPQDGFKDVLLKPLHAREFHEILDAEFANQIDAQLADGRRKKCEDEPKHQEISI